MLTKRFLYAPLLSAGLLAITACTSHLQVTKLKDAPLLEHNPKADIRVFAAGETVPNGYEILGKVYAYKRGGSIFSKPKDGSLKKMMLEPATRLGANAIIDFRSSIFNGKEYNSIRRWASGLAVKTHSSAASPESIQSDLLVAIAPPHYAKSQSDKNEAKFTKAMLDAAQYYLEQKGYYVIIATGQSLPLTKGRIDSMAAEELTVYGDRRAGLILTLALNEIGSGHAVIAGTGDAELTAMLIAKNNRNVVWQNTAGGSTFSLGMINTLFQDRKKEALYNAVKHVIEPLPTRAEDYYAGQ